MSRSRPYVARTSGTGTITFFNESVKKENKFLVLKQEKQLNYIPKNPFSAVTKSTTIQNLKPQTATFTSNPVSSHSAVLPTRIFYSGNRLLKKSIVAQ